MTTHNTICTYSHRVSQDGLVLASRSVFVSDREEQKYENEENRSEDLLLFIFKK